MTLALGAVVTVVGLILVIGWLESEDARGAGCTGSGID